MSVDIVDHILAVCDGNPDAALRMVESAAQLSLFSETDVALELLSRAQNMATGRQAKMGLELLLILIKNVHSTLFTNSFPEWAKIVLSTMKQRKLPDEDTVGWRCLAALFSRLESVSVHAAAAKREAAALASKMIAAFLSLDMNQPVTPEALIALQIALNVVPGTFRHQSKALEATFTKLALTPHPRKSAQKCLVMLPRSFGDSDSWSVLAQSLLATAHGLLDAMFYGFENGQTFESARNDIDPSAVSLIPLPTPGASTLTELRTSAEVFKSVLQCLDMVLQTPYPVPVPLPTSAIIALIQRIVSIEARHGVPRETELLLALPGIVVTALDLLHTLISHGHMVAVCGDIARMLVRCLESHHRIFHHSSRVQRSILECISRLLQVGGMAVVRMVSAPLLLAVEGAIYKDVPQSPGEPQMPLSKKQKQRKNQSAATLSPTIVEATVPDIHTTAALGALELLLTQGALLLSQEDLYKADAFALHAAVTIEAAFQKMSSDNSGGPCAVSIAQLASYKALLSSVLAPVNYRPSYLPQAVRLYTRGLKHPSCTVADWCSKALESLEALLHPRAAPALILSSQDSLELPIPKFWCIDDPLTDMPPLLHSKGVDAAVIESDATPAANATIHSETVIPLELELQSIQDGSKQSPPRYDLARKECALMPPQEEAWDEDSDGPLPEIDSGISSEDEQ